MRARRVAVIALVCLFASAATPWVAHAQEAELEETSPSEHATPAPDASPTQEPPSATPPADGDVGNDDPTSGGPPDPEEPDEADTDDDGEGAGGNGNHKDNKGGKGAGSGGNSGGNGDPNGNNGTIKIESTDFDDIPNNVPHPGCEFVIEMYGYDQGDLQATYIFTNQAPSGSGEIDRGTVDIGQDPAGGGRDLDARVHIDLADGLAASGAEAHPKQGYHVKLTVHAEGSIGADVKHKVFWVEECEDEVALVLAGSLDRSGGRAGLGAEVAPATATRGSRSEVAGARLAAAGEQAGAAPGSLPVTGPGALALAAWALLGTALVFAGAAPLRSSRHADADHEDDAVAGSGPPQ